MGAGINLWPDTLVAPPITTPATILKEQAAFLGEATNYAIQGKVNSIYLPNDTFSVTLDLVVPSIRNYSYQLLRLEHDLSLYPLTIFAEFNAPPVRSSSPAEHSFRERVQRLNAKKEAAKHNERRVKNEKEFIATLKELFESGHIKTLLTALLAQAKS